MQFVWEQYLQIKYIFFKIYIYNGKTLFIDISHKYFIGQITISNHILIINESILAYPRLNLNTNN